MLPVIENHPFPIEAKNMKNINHQMMIVSPQMHEKMQELCMTTTTTTTAMLHNIAISNNRQSISGDQPSVSDIQQSSSVDGSKRSTFAKTVEITSLTSETLEVPYYMYTARKAKRVKKFFFSQ
ncbi:unnamed protein product [Onchocerca flexuosa]|uniref:MADS-box domain-containing protein n=1 Tax=Onchocerca flexuosa TaxID=387005 RepID=A0A183HJS8_9BILA|nr:unnamed protein product [Onchocerca flexuosa]